MLTKKLINQAFRLFVMDGNEKSKMHERALELSFISAQIKGFEEQLLALAQKEEEVLLITGALTNVKSLNVGHEVFSQLGAGLYFKTNLVDNSELLVNVGADVFIKKSLIDAQETLEQQRLELQKIRESIFSRINVLSLKSQEIEREFEKRY